MGGVDVSTTRITRTAKAYCSEYAECEADYFDYAFDTLAECVSDVSVYFSAYVSLYGRECADAILDLIECEAALDCDDQDENACDTESAAARKVCPDEDTTASKKVRGLRIPR